MLSSAAAAEVYFSDANIEISGSGSRSSRNCTVAIKPSRTLGDEAAPRLTLMTSGQSRMQVAVERSSLYQSVTIVQNNVRSLFIGDTFGIDQFKSSEIGKAIRSQRLFYVTARRADNGKYVSSRYERIDFDALLSRVEANCPFEAEAWMTNPGARESAERSLSVPLSDLTLIRWALNKKYGNSSEKPDSRLTLSPLERGYLKRYNADNGAPISSYLTQDSARRLTAEGQTLAALARPSPSPVPTPTPDPPRPEASGYFKFRLCNKSRVTIAVSTAHHVSPTDSKYVVEGWWIIEKGDCGERTYPKGWFYFYGEQRNSGGKLFWGGDNATCVTYPGPFTRVDSPGYKCDRSRLKKFISIFIKSDQDEYTHNLTN